MARPEVHAVGVLVRRHVPPLAWHSGFRLSLTEVPAAFRGCALRALAARAAVDGVIDAASLGACANSLTVEPPAWSDWGSREDTLTRIRRLWHLLVLGRVDPDDEAPPIR